jgi:DNA-binding IscR family transcriptional regulator
MRTSAERALAPIACASKTRYQRCDDCASEASCPVRLFMIEAQRTHSQVLDSCTLARIRQLGETPAAPPPRLAVG